MRRSMWLAVILSLCVAIPAVAQKTTGTIQGVVTDPQGAVVANAQVTITNVATANTRNVTTSSQGFYSAPDLEVGTYNVTVKQSGYKTYVSSGVALDTASIMTVNVPLTLGSATEEVTVEASTVQVETATGTLSSTVDGDSVRELPLNGRSFAQLTQLTPGVSPAENFDTKHKGLEAGVDFSINGNNTTGNLFLVDGVNNNDIGSNRTILVYPSLQAIDEMKILTNSYGAEYGQASGGVISIITRGGTNQFHGGAFYDGRNTALNANDYFNNEHNQPKNELHRNDYGFNIGGPIIKNRLFFFESEEWNKEVRGHTRFANVPTLAELNGDFSNPRVGCEPIPNQSHVPAGQISKAGQTMAQLTYPAPNVTGAVTNCDNWVSSENASVPWREDNVRVDFKLTNTLSIMGRYTNDSWSNPFPSTLGYWGDDIYPSVEGNWTQPGRQATIKLTKLFGGTAVNDFQFSYAANKISVSQGGSGQNGLTPTQIVAAINAASPSYFNPATKFGGAAGLGQPLFWSALTGTGNFQGQGGAVGGISDMGPWYNNEQLFILKDDFSKVRGSHTFKVGFIATNNQKNEINSNASNANSQYWSTASAANSSGNGVFDLLWNKSTWGGSEVTTNAYALMRWHDYEFYGQDSWKMRRNLTLEYGLRYSFLRQPFTGNDQYSTFNPAVYSASIGGSSPCNGMWELKPGIAQCNALGFAGAALAPDRALRPQNNHMIAPRLGLAWDPKGDGKMVFRAGIGQFFQRDRVAIDESGAANTPFVLSAGFTRSLDVAPTNLTASGTPSRSYQQTSNLPNTWQYNLTFERELAQNTKLQVGYVGNKGFHLLNFGDINQVSAQDRVNFALGNSNNFRPFGLTTTPTGIVGNWGLLPQQQYRAESNYNALQALIRTRMKSIDAQFAYTWSKSLADTDISDSSGGTNNNNTLIDVNNPQLDYGPTLINRPSVFTGNIVYNAPALAGQNGVVRTTLGGWELAAILQYTSGPSLTVQSGSGSSPGGGLQGLAGGFIGTGSAGQGNERPNQIVQVPCQGSGLQWINPAKFTLNGYTVGGDPTSPRGICSGPGIANTDFSIYKNFRIKERFTLKFSMDFFNFFNKPQFTTTGMNFNLSNNATYCAASDIGSPNSPWCSGLSAGQAYWTPTGQTFNNLPATSLPCVASGKPCSFTFPAGLQNNFGQVANDRGPREIQYGLALSF
jgi:hypothetical protein